MTGIGERIKKIRLLKGLTQKELATELNISHQSVSKWERAESIPNTFQLIALSKVFSVTTDYLLLGNHRQFEGSHSSGAVKPIEAMTHEELLVLFEKTLVQDMTTHSRNLLQALGYVSRDDNPEWTVEGKQLSDHYWYRASAVILQEMDNCHNMDALYMAVNRQIDIPKAVFYQFVDDLVAIGKITSVSGLIR